SAIQEEGESEYDDEPSGSAARPVKILKTEAEPSMKPEIFAVDVDSSYQPPLESPIRPSKLSTLNPPNLSDKVTVACFYVRQKDAAKEYYRAVYLMRRTVKD